MSYLKIYAVHASWNGALALSLLISPLFVFQRPDVKSRVNSGGYADISRLHAWNLDFVENLPAGSRYREMSSKVSHKPISRDHDVAL